MLLHDAMAKNIHSYRVSFHFAKLISYLPSPLRIETSYALASSFPA